MANGTVVSSALIMTLDLGVDGAGKPVFKRKSFRNIKTTATHDQLFNIAGALSPLQEYPVASIDRDDAIHLTA